MPDPFFDIALWGIRGFDLGDDAILLEELQNQARLDSGARLLRAVLRLRSGDRSGAGEDLRALASDLEQPGLAAYLLSQLALDAGAPDQAETWLDAVDAAGEAAEVPEADRIHARGSLARLRGDVDEAIEAYRRGLQLEHDDGRCKELARLLLASGRGEEARAVLEHAVAEHPDATELVYELAATAAVTADEDTATLSLQRALQRDPALAERAQTDERFGPEPSASVQRLLEGSEPDLTWLDAFPPWLQALRRDNVDGPALTWLSREQSRVSSQELEDAYGKGPLGTLHTQATLALSRELLQSRKPVALGPVMTSREGRSEPTVLFIDVHRVDRLFLAPSRAYPPFLWLDVGRDREGIARAIASVLPDASPARLELPRRARGFMGYRLCFGVPNPYGREAEPANALELDRHFSLSPFVDTGAWGSAFADDPWPDRIPPQPDLVSKLAARQQAMATQAEGSVWSMTRRTLHSRSHLRLSLHQRDLFVIEVRYAPAPFESILDALNEHFGTDYPTDMPLDAVAALLGFQFSSASDLQDELESSSDPEKIAGCLCVLAALRYDDLGVVRLFRRYMDHPDSVVRTTLCNIFASYNMESLLEEMTLLETEPDLGDQIEALLDQGLAPPQDDPYSDYDLELESEESEEDRAS